MKKSVGFILIMIFWVQGLFAEEQSCWKTDLGLYYVISSGNTSMQTFSAKLASEWPWRSVRFLTKASVLNTRDSGTEKANRWDAGLRAEKSITKKLFGFLETGYLKDTFSGYTYRFSAGPGLGYEFVKNDNHELKGLVSGQYNFDKFSAGPVDKEDYAAGKAGLNYAWVIRENVKLTTGGTYLVSLDDTEKYFLNAEAALNVTLSSRLALGLSYTLNYQNLTPASDIKKTDTLYITSLLIHW
jgi:putative salt-induced outer membrane protein